MSVVDDLRKLLQDLVTPEVRALTVKTDNLQGNVTDLRSEMNRRFEQVHKQIADLRGEMREMRGELRAEVQNGLQYIVAQL